MNGVPCRTCREDCGEACTSLQRARQRELDALESLHLVPVATQGRVLAGFGETDFL